MTNFGSTLPKQRSTVDNLRSVVRTVFGNRFGLLAVAALVLSLGAYANWGWLVAAGIAPMLLSVAPCAAMCAFGMCTMGMSKTPSVNAQSPKILSEDGKSIDHKGCCW